MRLSDSEQRLLAELELALTREDPRYVEQFSIFPATRYRRWRRVVRGLSLRWRQ